LQSETAIFFSHNNRRALGMSAVRAIEVVKEYIQNQEEHHRKRDFEQEFVALLRNCGIVYDERYVFG
jgi:hypothetical protein